MRAVTVGPEDISAAAERIAGRVRRTPVLELGALSGASVVAKLELLTSDPPYARPSNSAFTVEVSNLELSLPTLEGAAAVGRLGRFKRYHRSCSPPRRVCFLLV